MQKLISIIMVTVMVLSMSACAAPVAQEAAPAEEKAAFTGKYIVNAQYVMDHMKDENVLIVDARGEDAAKGGTVEGAIAVIWQQFASVSDGAAGDPMWGTILDTDRLSAALSAAGISQDKEIILFAAAQNGWGDDGRILWELVAVGFPNVKMVDGGYDALVAAGVPTVKGRCRLYPGRCHRCRY